MSWSSRISLPLLLGGISALTAAGVAAASQHPLSGRWTGLLTTPGGDIRFELTLLETSAGWQAQIRNGTETQQVTASLDGGGQLRLAFPHFDAEIVASLEEQRLIGGYRRRRSATEWAQQKFKAVRPKPESAPPAEDHAAAIPDGQWSVRFSSSSDPAVAIFRQETDGTRWATILTTLGDYRFLSCRAVDARTFEMSVFDGGHAFLFRAVHQADGSLSGDFWSGNHWHETWTAAADNTAELPDPLKLTTTQQAVSLADLHVRHLSGAATTLADDAFAGQARIISLFGSWCPNCHDASAFLAELHQQYAPAGLTIIGVAFEVTGDFERDSRQVRKYVERFNVPWPVVIGGQADKQLASQSFPLLDAVRAYPTMIFIDSSDNVAAVYTGFNGPATGAAHGRMKEQLHGIVRRLLQQQDTN
jgi:thiol-disulfide isomerase/thioredoxin